MPRPVVRGLLYLLVKQQRSLLSYVRKIYDDSGEQLFKDTNAWTALTEILDAILKDDYFHTATTYLIVDGLDECTEDLSRLLDLIRDLSAYPGVKWLVSSRNWSDIEKGLDNASQGAKLDLELNEESVSAAVTTYIHHKVDWLAKKHRYNHETRATVQHHLLSNAQGTFLWVALVCRELANLERWKAQKRVTEFPPGLDPPLRTNDGPDQ